MKALNGLFVFAWVIVVGCIARGYVLAKLWAWFVVAQLGLPKLSIAGALGMSVIVSMLTHHPTKSDDKEKSEKSATVIAVTAVLMTLLYPAVFLLEGWIVKQWLP